MTHRELIEQRAAKVVEMRAIDSKAGPDGALPPELQKAWDALKGEVNAIEERAARQAFLDETDRAADGRQIAGTGDNRLDSELRNFSLLRAIAHKAGLGVDAGREMELSREMERRSGRKAEGFFAPTVAFEKRVLTTAAPAGGPGSNLISADYRGDLYFDRLRAAMSIRGLGARVLSGLTGNLSIPALKGSVTSGWVAENAALTASDPTFRQVGLTPKHAGAIAEASRNMLLQSSPDVEQLFRDDMAKVLAEALDRVAIKGGGANEPTGILSTVGIGDVAMGTNGLAMTQDTPVDLLAKVDAANVTNPVAFLTNSKVKAAALKLKDGQNRPFGLDVLFRGNQVAFSNLVPSDLTKGTSNGVCSALIAGDFSDLILGFWSELDILVNPYESTAYARGSIQIRAMLTCDLAIRHPESFAAVKDILA